MPLDMDKPREIPAGTPGYETTDANVGGVYNFLVILGIILVAIGLISWGMFRVFSGQDKAEQPSVSPFVETRQLPLGPTLQVNPREDWLKFREEQERTLETLAWQNRASGTAQVPIEDAMDIVAKKGLPVQGDSSAPATAAAAEKSPAQGAKKP